MIVVVVVIVVVKADVVITEDSDVIVYGCKRVLFKLESDGFGDEIQLR